MRLSNLFFKRKYSLKRSLKTFFELKDFLLNKKKTITTSTYEEMKTLLLDLKRAIDAKDKEKAYLMCNLALEEMGKKVKKNLWDYFNEYIIDFGLLLLIVALINQVWFQMYQIPSGSMRPTLMEKDRLIATKTTFGINLPFGKGHLHLNPKQLKRGNIVILQNDKLPKSENKSRYLFVFPAQKQFVKRLIGKPGDTLYFYGGKIYGLDRDGNEITAFHDSPAFENLEHIPFMSFEGKVLADSKAKGTQIHSPVYLYQMDQLIGKLYLGSSGSFQGKFYNGSQWVDESPNLSYLDLWGIRNYAMVRMLAQGQDNILEFSHSPHVNFPRPHLGMDLEGRLRPKLSLEKSYLTLDQEGLKNVKKALSTSRFVVKNEKAGNYSLEKKFKAHDYSPTFKGVPDGVYEFINGTGYSISRSGAQKELSKDHPLNSSDPKRIQQLFNLGMMMFTLFEPSSQYQDFLPNRYAYFRNGDLYLMGHPIYRAKDPLLTQFASKEQEKTYPFKDHHAPLLSNGQLNKDLIINYGLHIPKGHYLFLGDNHANSRDCRDWGFIPEKNVQGSLAVILWPFSSRLGFLNQNHVSWFSGSTQLITILGISLFIGSLLYNRKQRKRKL